MKPFLAFDMILYEDLDALTFLQSDPVQHILIRSGKQWYAFHRSTLHQLMKQNKSYLSQVGTVYDTPYHHTITQSALDALLCTSYSIYELIPCYEQQHKSLYAVKCLTRSEWESGEMGRVFEPSDSSTYWLLSPNILSLPSIANPLPLLPTCWAEGMIFRNDMDSSSSPFDISMN